MCLQCFRRVDEETSDRQLRDALYEPKYEKWNNCGLATLFCIGIGYHGPFQQMLAIVLIEGYKKRTQNEDVDTLLRKMRDFNKFSFTKEEIQAYIFEDSIASPLSVQVTQKSGVPVKDFYHIIESAIPQVNNTITENYNCIIS